MTGGVRVWGEEREKGIEVERKERGNAGLKAKRSVEKGIRGRGSGKRKRHSRGEGVYTRQQTLAVSGRASPPAPGAPGLWLHNEGLFEFTFKHHRQRLEKQCPSGDFY